MLVRIKNILPQIFVLLCALSALPACKVTKTLGQNESLLVRNKFLLSTPVQAAVREKMHEDVAKITAQKPNIRVFGFLPMRMWLYYSATHGKKLTKFKQWIIDKVGEAPVVYDSSLTEKSKLQIENYLFNAGFFYATVNDTVIIKKKRATVIYNLHTGDPWTIGEVELPAGHNTYDSLVRLYHLSPFLHKGARFDVTNLKQERDRIENVLRNKGYFTFNREYVTFDLDSSSATKTVNIKINVNPPSDTSEHQQYRMNEIYVVTDYSVDALSDTIHRDTVTVGEFHFIAQKMKFRKGILMDNIFFRRNQLYRKEDETRTINHLAQLGTFKFTNLDYVKAKNREGNYLDCIISLTPAKKQAWQYTLEVNV
ncbi:MAG TPA: POTRA domain-containing protein, partial [Chitinophagales bacterium]|nr:POTRA domain-containing protein [Chitinophagales bacterium]